MNSKENYKVNDDGSVTFTGGNDGHTETIADIFRVEFANGGIFTGLRMYRRAVKYAKKAGIANPRLLVEKLMLEEYPTCFKTVKLARRLMWYIIVGAFSVLATITSLILIITFLGDGIANVLMFVMIIGVFVSTFSVKFALVEKAKIQGLQKAAEEAVARKRIRDVLINPNTHITMKQMIKVPKGRLAGEDAVAKMKSEQRKRICDALNQAEPVKLGVGGNAMNTSGDVTINTPEGKLAGEDAAAKRRRELRERLLNGETVKAGKGGSAMSNGESTIEIGKGKLAGQWYDSNPTLLAMEKIAMERNFPQFRLEKLDDGRLCWVGAIEPGIYESKFGEKRQYHLMAVYDNNHPHQQMGSSVRVYPLMPDVDELVEMAGFWPYHLLQDAVGNRYLCTNEAGDQKVGTTTTTAASVLGWATKWLIAYELVLTGDLPREKFNAHGGI